MKRTLLFIFALVALAGVLNCALIEPAFACKDEATHSEQSGDVDCCFVHCAMHHQWISASIANFSPDSLQLMQIIPSHLSVHPDSALAAIFHPPLPI